MMTLLLGLAASTLLSEDAACLAAAALIREGTLSPAAGVGACAAGIYAGDALLWGIGRLFRRRFGRYETRKVDSAGAILLTRFVPGSRLPLYLAAGAVGTRPRSFFLWTFVAAIAWTPVIVLGAASSLIAGAVLLVAVQLGKRIDWRRAWWRARARVARSLRWEFWPAAILYAPVAVHIARLALRHGGLGTLSAANPGIPEGGFVGESKFQILSSLPQDWVVPAALVSPGDVDGRLTAVRQLTRARGWEFPLVLKPDAGQRGTGVRRVCDWAAVRAYLEQQPAPVLVQPYHPGPFEAGIFYYRYPDAARGRIFSITDKVFPVLVGDGESSVEDLIWRHRRYRLQASVFLARHADARTRVPAAGERFPLGIAGNHAQGALFRDGAAFITPELEQRIDAIARSVPGFFIGRFDVRYGSIARFRRGEDLAIVELNGVTSESTNIYDPAFTLAEAWRVLCRQWTLIFEIGAANRARGQAQAPAGRLLRLSLRHLRAAPVLPIAS